MIVDFSMKLNTNLNKYVNVKINLCFEATATIVPQNSSEKQSRDKHSNMSESDIVLYFSGGDCSE